jgi:hypothetical protein
MRRLALLALLAPLVTTTAAAAQPMSRRSGRRAPAQPVFIDPAQIQEGQGRGS